MRISPRLNESINEEWLSDKGRFSYDGLKRQRLNIPLLRTSEGFQTVLWPDALKAIAEGLQGVKGNEMKAIAGKLADAEAMVALKVTGMIHMYMDCCPAELCPVGCKADVGWLLMCKIDPGELRNAQSCFR